MNDHSSFLPVSITNISFLKTWLLLFFWIKVLIAKVHFYTLKSEDIELKMPWTIKFGEATIPSVLIKYHNIKHKMSPCYWKFSADGGILTLQNLLYPHFLSMAEMLKQHWLSSIPLHWKMKSIYFPMDAGGPNISRSSRKSFFLTP